MSIQRLTIELHECISPRFPLIVELDPAPGQTVLSIIAGRDHSLDALHWPGFGKDMSELLLGRFTRWSVRRVLYGPERTVLLVPGRRCAGDCSTHKGMLATEQISKVSFG